MGLAAAQKFAFVSTKFGKELALDSDPLTLPENWKHALNMRVPSIAACEKLQGHLASGSSVETGSADIHLASQEQTDRAHERNQFRPFTEAQ